MLQSEGAVRRARWAVAAIFLANGVVIGTWAAQIPLVQARLAISHSVLGIALLTMALGALVSMPLGGAAIARFGSALVTRGAVIALIAVFPFVLVAPHPLLLMAALFLFGAANGVVDVAMNAHGVMVEHRLGRPVMSSFHGMWSLGGLLGAGLAAALLPVMSPLTQALLALALLLIPTVLSLFLLLPSAADGGNGGPAFALPNRLTVGLGVLCFLCMMTEGAVVDWSALHLQESRDLAPGPAAAGFAAFSACMAAGRFGGDWLRGHTGAAALVRWSALLAAFGLVVALLVPATVPAIAGYGLLGFGVANLVPVFFGAAGRIPGQATGTGIAAVATLGYTGFLVGPPFIGFLADLTNLTFALGTLFFACAAIVVGAHTAAAGERSVAQAG